jgi:hypothetical protein
MRNKDTILMEAQLQAVAKSMLEWELEKGLQECNKAIRLLLLAKITLRDLEEEDIPLIVNALEDAEQYIEGEIFVKGIDPNLLSKEQTDALNTIESIIEKLKRIGGKDD